MKNMMTEILSNYILIVTYMFVTLKPKITLHLQIFEEEKYTYIFGTKFSNSNHSVLVRKKRGPGGKHLDTK